MITESNSQVWYLPVEWQVTCLFTYTHVTINSIKTEILKVTSIPGKDLFNNAS